MAGAWTYHDFVKDALTRVKEVSAEQLTAWLESAPSDLVLLDVRERDEYDAGILPGAVLLPRGLLERHVHEHVANRAVRVVVYCSNGNASALAADVLLRMGFERTANLSGGFERWKHLGLPTSGGQNACLVPGAKRSWDDVRREFAIVARKVPVLGSGQRELVYLDHAASTHAPASVLEAYTNFLAHEYANVHRGTHLLSRKATERFEEAYYVVADFLGAELKNGAVCFTQNTTHAIDIASHIMADRPGKVITTELEHHSNELPHRSRGPVLRARMKDNGELDLDHLDSLLRSNEVKLVCVTAGSNVTGVMPPIHQIARMAHDAGALILVDAAQALSRMPIDVKPFEDPEHLDFLAGAGHKAYAPFGAGFLYGPRDLMVEAEPYLPGGGTAAQVTARSVSFLDSPERHMGGTPNIAGVVGMSKALLFLESIGRQEIRQHEIKLTQQAIDGLRNIGGVTIYGPTEAEKRLAVVSFNVEGVDHLMTAAVLSEEGALAVRNGRFCAHLYMDRLLKTHHVGGEVPTGAVRASFGLYSDAHDVERLVEFVGKVRQKKWQGHYRVKGDKVSAEFAGRCADKWMESAGEPEHGEAEAHDHGYLFEVFHPDVPERAYLIADPKTREAAIVDPVRERVDEYLDYLSAKNLQLKYTIETHTHADHLAGSVRLKDLTGAKMVMGHLAAPPCVDRHLKDGEVLKVGEVALEALMTPGHTADSMCLLLRGRVLTGDTMLIGGCGRSDLPSGNSEQLYASLRRLEQLPEETMVFPGHDYNNKRGSTIGRERKENRRLKLPHDDFISVMNNLALPPPVKLRESLAFNQKCGDA
ncbi:MAG: aminotransferase class V-fold PLP-dependent enzyme [Deltaproteobacteria bacterium]|jgi:cysteine desulfurase/selenocysteine lyase|nr:aminotransferase class V-fold PLP-dependent enzyme [Deltaproteobacteria bacterium]